MNTSSPRRLVKASLAGVRQAADYNPDAGDLVAVRVHLPGEWDDSKYWHDRFRAEGTRGSVRVYKRAVEADGVEISLTVVVVRKQP